MGGLFYPNISIVIFCPLLLSIAGTPLTFYLCLSLGSNSFWHSLEILRTFGFILIMSTSLLNFRILCLQENTYGLSGNNSVMAG